MSLFGYQSRLGSFPFGLIATSHDPIYDPSITPFKKPSKITPQAMPSTILESEVFGR